MGREDGQQAVEGAGERGGGILYPSEVFFFKGDTLSLSLLPLPPPPTSIFFINPSTANMMLPKGSFKW